MSLGYQFKYDGVKFQIACNDHKKWYQREYHPVFGFSIWQPINAPIIRKDKIKIKEQWELITTLKNKPLDLPKN